MDRRTFFRIPSAPMDIVQPLEAEPKKALTSIESSNEELAKGRGSLLGGGALMASGVMFAGHELMNGSLGDPLRIGLSSMVTLTLLYHGVMSYKEGAARLDLSQQHAIKSGIEKATEVKIASELETTPIEPPIKERHLHLVK